MGAGRYGRGGAYPYHATLDGVGLMVSAKKDGTLDWTEKSRDFPNPEGAGGQRLVALREDFSGGFGQMREDGTPEGHRALFFSRATGSRIGRDPVGGGADPRWGGIMGGPRVHAPQDLTVLTTAAAAPFDATGGTKVRRLAAFTPSSGAFAGQTVYLAAVGHNLIGTVDPTNWAGGTILKQYSNSIVDLKVYGSRKGGAELEIALNGGAAREVTYDLATFYSDGHSTGGTDPLNKRKIVPQGVYIWDATDNQYYDLTLPLTDDNPETGTGEGGTGYLANFATTDYILVAFRHPFEGIEFQLGPHQNGNAANAVVELWTDNPTGAGVPVPGWDAVPVVGLADTTKPAAASLQQTGVMTWTYTPSPNHVWTPTVLTNQFESEALYFAKVRFSGPLDANVVVQEVKVRYQLAPQAYAVAGTNLVMIVDNGTLVSTPSGGTDGVIYDTTGPFAISSQAGGAFAPNSGEVIGAATLAGTVYVVKDDGIYSVSSGGLPAEIAPHMAEQPSVEDGQGFTVWDTKLYASHDWELLEVQPDGRVQAVGPERLTFGATTVQFRATALAGHGQHFLYAAFKGSDGHSYLGAYGVYRHVVDTQTQVESWQRMDVWSIVGDLENGRLIRSMRVMLHSGQPYLVMGDDDGAILYSPLPKGFHPLDAGSGYEWSDMHAEATFPEYDGHDPTRRIVAYRATFRVRNANGTHTVVLSTKGGHVDDSSAWVPRCTASDIDGDGFEDQAFGTVHDAYGLNVRVVLTRPAADHAVGVILDAFAPWYRQPLLGNQREWTLNVQAHDDVRTLQGRRIPRTTTDWEAIIRRWVSPPAGSAQRFALVTPSGEARVVMVDGYAQTVGRPHPQAPPLVSFALSVSSAE